MAQLPPLSEAGRRKRAALANARRFHPDAPETVALHQDFKAQRLADYIEQQIAAAPSLTGEAREELARILRPAPTGAASMPTAEDFAAELRAETGFDSPIGAIVEDASAFDDHNAGAA